MNPKESPLWPAFVAMFDENDVSLTQENLWMHWWEFFAAGAKAQYEHSQEEARSAQGNEPGM
jgi:hypothetical protein